LFTIRLANGAIATSGQARRGFRVGGRWYGHCLDARTGMPIEHLASVSVIAPTAMLADVLATVMSTMTPEEGVDWIEGSEWSDSVGVFFVDIDGSHRANAVFESHRGQ
jgi:thiamine biosynthesis lipoprotein